MLRKSLNNCLKSTNIKFRLFTSRRTGLLTLIGSKNHKELVLWLFSIFLRFFFFFFSLSLSLLFFSLFAKAVV